MEKPLICVDFDATIFDGYDVLPGCVEALTELRKSYRVMIFSARPTDGEREHMRRMLDKFNVPYDIIGPVKPNAVAFIDDKGVHFETWSTVKTCGY